MTTDRMWHDQAVAALQNAIELFSPGALTFAIGEEGHALAVAPSLFEHEDEDEDEDDVYAFFHFDIGSFTEVFDEPPQIGWRTFPDSVLSFEGQIDGEDAIVEVFGHPFEDAQPVGIIDQDGEVHELPLEANRIDQELEHALEIQAEAFRDKFGRDPGPNDPIFFDPDADEPTPLDPGQITAEIAAAGDRAALPAAYVYAIEKTGLIVTEANMHLLSEADLDQWQAAVEEGEEIHGAVVHRQPIGQKQEPN